MIAPPNNNYSNLEAVARQARNVFADLSASLSDQKKIEPFLNEIRKLLECMALSTCEYDVAVARISNARRYLESNETGAAKYELRLLISGLQSELAVEDISKAEQPEPPSDAPVQRSIERVLGVW